MSQIQNLYIIDPNLVDYGGHYLTYAKSVSSEAKNRGIGITWLTAKNFRKSLAPDYVEIVEIFDHNVFYEENTTNENSTVTNFYSYNKYFYQKLIYTDILKSRNSVFLFPNVIQNQLYSILEWSNQIQETSHAVVILRWNNAYMPYNVSRSFTKQILKTYHHCLSNYKIRHKNITIASDTLRLAHFYSQISGDLVKYIPNPQTGTKILQNLGKTGEIDRHSEPVLGFYGSFSMLRGSHIIPDIINGILKENNQVSFRCQISNHSKQENEKIITTQSQNPQKVILLSGILDTSLYYSCLATTTLIIMPYSQEFYMWGSSGIACEALSLGIPSVMTRNTTMEDEYKGADAGYKSATTWSPNSFIEATLSALSSIRHLTRRSKQACDNYINQTSPATFLDVIICEPDQRDIIHGRGYA